jgi:hypothetical protein
MSAQDFEAFLATIYVDKKARESFLTDPIAEAKKYGLSENECNKLRVMDITGLAFAARSFERKREIKLKHSQRKIFPNWLRFICRDLP